MGDKNIIGRQVAKIRVLKGISQKDFIARLQTNDTDINPSSMSKIEGQTRQVTDKEVAAIAKALQVSISELFQKAD